MNGEGRRLARLEADAQLLAARIEHMEALLREMSDAAADFGRATAEVTRLVAGLYEQVGQLREGLAK